MSSKVITKKHIKEYLLLKVAISDYLLYPIIDYCNLTNVKRDHCYVGHSPDDSVRVFIRSVNQRTANNKIEYFSRYEKVFDIANKHVMNPRMWLKEIIPDGKLTFCDEWWSANKRMTFAKKQRFLKLARRIYKIMERYHESSELKKKHPDSYVSVEIEEFRIGYIVNRTDGKKIVSIHKEYLPIEDFLILAKKFH